MAEEPTFRAIVVKCPSVGCANFGIEMFSTVPLVTTALLPYSNDGKVGDDYPHWGGVFCSACGTQIVAAHPEFEGSVEVTGLG